MDMQASPEELDQALREHHALCLDGLYCRQVEGLDGLHSDSFSMVAVMDAIFGLDVLFGSFCHGESFVFGLLG